MSAGSDPKPLNFYTLPRSGGSPPSGSVAPARARNPRAASPTPAEWVNDLDEDYENPDFFVDADLGAWVRAAATAGPLGSTITPVQAQHQVRLTRAHQVVLSELSTCSGDDGVEGARVCHAQDSVLLQRLASTSTYIKVRGRDGLEGTVELKRDAGSVIKLQKSTLELILQELELAGYISISNKPLRHEDATFHGRFRSITIVKGYIPEELHSTGRGMVPTSKVFVDYAMRHLDQDLDLRVIAKELDMNPETLRTKARTWAKTAKRSEAVKLSRWVYRFRLSLAARTRDAHEAAFQAWAPTRLMQGVHTPHAQKLYQDWLLAEQVRDAALVADHDPIVFRKAA